MTELEEAIAGTKESIDDAWGQPIIEVLRYHAQLLVEVAELAVAISKKAGQP